MLTLIATLLPALAPFQDDDPLDVHIRLHKKVAPAIVGVRGRGRRGTGIVVHKSGLVITAMTATGDRTDDVEIFLKGEKSTRAQVVDRHEDLGLVILKIDPKLVHFTRGTPDMAGHEGAAYAQAWWDELCAAVAGGDLQLARAARQAAPGPGTPNAYGSSMPAAGLVNGFSAGG